MSDLCPVCGHPKHYGQAQCGAAAYGDPCATCLCTDAQAAKADAGKLRYDLIPHGALTELARIYTYGAAKYEADSWRTVPDAIPRYRAAAWRHWVAYLSGEILDPESGLPHLAHLAWNVVSLSELEATHDR